MNIFILSEERDSRIHYQQQTHFHIDKHVVKMIAESTQMLVSTASQPGFNLPAEIVQSIPCKPLSASLMKHPCTVWTACCIEHFNYLACLALQLCQEHQYRYPLSPEHAYMPWLSKLVDRLSDMGFGPGADLPTSFAVAVKNADLRSTSTDHATALDIYRSYYVRDKRTFATWKKRMKPMWYLLREELLDMRAGI
jgi:hypothetical protein